MRGSTNRTGGDSRVQALPVAAFPRRPSVPHPVRDALELLTGACGGNLTAVIFFGSRLLGTSPNAASASDLIVIVRDYMLFYRDVGSQLPAARHIGIITALNRVLPPNIINLNDPGGMRTGAKCFIVSERDFRHAMSRASRDYFFRGRLSQRVEIVYARRPQARERVEEYLAMARRLTLDWVPFYFQESFTVEEYCLRMLEVSYAGEIRPESSNRVREVYEAQADFFRLVYQRVLDDAVSGGALLRAGNRYRVAEPRSRTMKRHWRWFWLRSKIRATLRWFKYMLTFDDWLDYIVHKVERRTGMRVELTPEERRAPFLLLWPKVYRVLRHMRSAPSQAAAAADAHGAPADRHASADADPDGQDLH